MSQLTDLPTTYVDPVDYDNAAPSADRRIAPRDPALRGLEPGDVRFGIPAIDDLIDRHRDIKVGVRDTSHALIDAEAALKRHRAGDADVLAAARAVADGKAVPKALEPKLVDDVKRAEQANAVATRAERIIKARTRDALTAHQAEIERTQAAEIAKASTAALKHLQALSAELERIARARGVVNFAHTQTRFTPAPISVAVGGSMNNVAVVLAQLEAELA